MNLNPLFSAADVLLPSVKDLEKWSVVACDQYTSQPDYWQQLQAFIGNAPSTYHMIFPEAYLGNEDDMRIEAINQAMRENLAKGIFRLCPNSFIFVERTMENGSQRQGLVGKLDLESYDFSATSTSQIRPTEGTVESRLPPRVKIRHDAPLELPHILALIDDPENIVMGPIAANADTYETVYDFNLFQGGRIRGRLISEEKIQPIQIALDQLFAKAQTPGSVAIPVGDGNHSLATAKACFESLKEKLSPEKWKVHPARWALVELVNLHQEALQIEPVHRIVFHTNPATLIDALKHTFPVKETPFPLQYVLQGQEDTLFLGLPVGFLPVVPLQKFLDTYLETHAGTLDYIHDDDALRTLANQEDTIGFFLPPMGKSTLLPSIQRFGALPRKTFSLGHASEKRFYLEARKIQL